MKNKKTKNKKEKKNNKRNLIYNFINVKAINK